MVTLLVGGGGKAVRGLARDISLSGIFVEVEETIPVNRRVEVLINCEDESIPVVATGEIVHSLSGYGVGVKFSTRSQKSAQAIAALIERFAKKRTG